MGRGRKSISVRYSSAPKTQEVPVSVTEISWEGRGAGSPQPEMLPRRTSGRHGTQATAEAPRPASALNQHRVLPTDLPAGEHSGPQRLEQAQPAHRPPEGQGPSLTPPSPPPFSTGSAHTCFPPDAGDAILQAVTRGRSSAHAWGPGKTQRGPHSQTPPTAPSCSWFPAHGTGWPQPRGARQFP